MSSDESSSSKDYQECVLQCKEAKRFYCLPTKPVMRNVWLYKLGLDDDDYYPSPSVCDKHFSEKMIESNGKLKSIAVPDMNLPTELFSKQKPQGLIQNFIPIQSHQKRTVIRKPTRFVKKDGPNLQPNPPQPSTSTPPVTVNSYPKPDASFPSTENWINDASNILVDYQLKVRGKHLCDVIEIPQYIVVFTVVKAKQGVKIHLSDKKIIHNISTLKRPAAKNHSQITEIITIDDDTDEAISPTSGATAIVQTNSTIAAKLDLPKGIQSTPSIEPPQLQQPGIQSKLSIERPQLQQIGIQSTPSIDLPQLKRPEPEIDIVYFTTDEVPPRRDRALQVDFSNKRTETAIQCDFQLDKDLMEMSCNAELYWMQSRFKVVNPQISMDECLVCGEIVKSNANKVRHAQGHEVRSSLCCQCGDMFDNKIKLKAHEQTAHSNNMEGSRKPQRCPKRNCTKAFHSRQQLNRHIQEHVETKQHKCNKCQECFSSSMKLSCHQRALDKCLRTRGWTSRRWSKRV